MNIVEKNVADIIPADYNPREITKKQYAEIKDSVNKFGLIDPLIVNMHSDRKNILVGGHQRLKIIKDMNIKKVPCVEVNLNAEEEKELNIRLNKNQGQWNFDSLANFFDTDNLINWGFDSKELSFTSEPLDLDTEELSLDKKFEVIIEVNDVETQENLYNELTDRGLKCRILSL